MEGFSFVTPVTGLNRPNTGKEDDDVYISFSNIVKDVSSCHFSILFNVSVGHAQRTDNIICQT
jgi:hypothetical protein